MAEEQITSGGQERIQPAAFLLSEAFKADPTVTYLLSSLTADQRTAYRPTFFRAILTAAAANGATFHEIDDWQSCGVICPPGSTVNRIGPSLYPTLLSVAWSIGFRGCQRMLYEMAHETKTCKAKALHDGEKYLYVYFLGTLEDGRGKGLCSTIVRHYQKMAVEQQAPVYMEAATEYSWRLYEKLGFVTVGEIVLGKGKVGADGEDCVGGVGVRLWGMIWRPEGEGERN